IRLVPMVASVGALANWGGGPKHPFYLRPTKERVAPMKRIMFLLAATAMMAAMLAIPGVALAQGGDVCVSNKGDLKVQKGSSTCSSDSTSQAVAVNDSLAAAVDDSKATAVNDGLVDAFDNSEATAVNVSTAAAFDNSKATAVNDSFAAANFDC